MHSLFFSSFFPIFSFFLSLRFFLFFSYFDKEDTEKDSVGVKYFITSRKSEHWRFGGVKTKLIKSLLGDLHQLT
ncbi:hypothetical protein DM01DRAFT_1028615 [Hesseltinella vesiculosa]|uniref:Uncharacterized protein n=1 Tax=Hesseltinella vesiculosa TaxID=101127 RepID=A0A1X2GIY5_9FUNG|nr:hypothetical protein DM01DRAFT_1028615 [Hesseltinella vesiculosa]